MSPVRALLLDAEGTLIQLREPAEQTYRSLAARHGYLIPEGALPQRLFPAIRNRPILPETPLDPAAFAEFERRSWRRLLAENLGSWAGDDPFFHELFQFYGAGEAWACMPNALPALAQARAKGIELAVVSNMDSRLPAILESLELRPLLSAVYYPAESGRAKPDRALYLEACRALGVAPAHALYVGDRERDCLAGARQAGLAVLRYAPGSGDSEALHDWAELLDRVAASGC